MKRMIALLMSFALLLTPALSAQESAAIRENRILWKQETVIAQSVTLTEAVFSNGDRQAEHYICYTPNRNVRLLASIGETLNGKQKLSELEPLEEQSGGRILGGVNGDYYVVASGMPLGIVLRDGELLSSDAGNYAIGFRADGTAVYGKPGQTLSFRIGTETFRLAGLNKTITTSNYYLYTPVWGSSFSSNKNLWIAVLRPNPGASFGLTGETSLTVERVEQAKGSIAIPEGCCVLCLPTDSDNWRLGGMRELKEGDTLTVTAQVADAGFADCVTAIGSLYPLISEGKAVEGLEKTDNNQAPRTAVGIRADGSVVLYTVDGRQGSYSKGLTFPELAQRLLELGCVEAGALDGGGSTSITAQLPGDGDCSLQNQPSGGEERKVPVCLLLKAGSGSGRLCTLSPYSDATVLLAGAQAKFLPGGCDECGAPVSVSGVRWSASGGQIASDGTFTAPKSGGSVKISAYYGSISGSKTVTVITAPDSLSLKTETGESVLQGLKLRPGESLRLTASAVWNQLPVQASNRQFQWELLGGIGSVSQDGVVTAGSENGYGTLRLSAGSCKLEIPVTVFAGVSCLDDFETVRSGSSTGLRWQGETLRDRVKYGYGSLRLDYDLSGGTTSFPMTQYATDTAPMASLWVWSDGSGNSLYARFEKETLLLDGLETAGWTLLELETGRYGALQALELQGSGSGTLWLDQLLIRESAADVDAPTVSLTVNGRNVQGRVSDWGEENPAKDDLTLTVDGQALSFGYDASTGQVTAQLPTDDGNYHRITLTAVDRSGNRNSASVLLSGSGDGLFADLSGHWAEADVNYLAQQGVARGWTDGNGNTVYGPNQSITRGEFAVMLCRWLGVEQEADLSVLDRFQDASQIPDWARSSAAAAVELGLIQGSQEGDALYFRPQDTISRAQAAVILGRTMPGGRMGGELCFADASSIPDWAAPYVSQLSFMGVLKGDGTNYDPNGKLTRAQTAKILSALS